MMLFFFVLFYCVWLIRALYRSVMKLLKVENNYIDWKKMMRHNKENPRKTIKLK